MTEKIEQWAKARNLHAQDPKIQLSKLMEESGELAKAILKNDKIEQIDAIGDVTVVLIVLSLQLGLDYKECVKSAYDVIKDRKGKMIDGVFVKEEESKHCICSYPLIRGVEGAGQYCAGCNKPFED